MFVHTSHLFIRGFVSVESNARALESLANAIYLFIYESYSRVYSRVQIHTDKLRNNTHVRGNYKIICKFAKIVHFPMSFTYLQDAYVLIAGAWFRFQVRATRRGNNFDSVEKKTTTEGGFSLAKEEQS